MRYAVILVCVMLFSCKNDSNQLSPNHNSEEPASSTTDVKTEQPDENALPFDPDELKGPELKVLKSTRNEYPEKAQWSLDETYQMSGADLAGAAAINENLLAYSDMSNSRVMLYEISTKKPLVVMEDIKVRYLQQRVSRLILPLLEKDSVIVFRGGAAFHRMQIPLELSGPSAFDGFRIDDWTLVDKGGNRLVYNRSGDYGYIGKSGSGDSEFNSPESIIYIGNSFYVSDAGNKRIQVFGLDNSFRKSFGSEQLNRPGGLTTDGNLLFVCDDELDKIFVYNQEGRYLYDLEENLNDPRDVFFQQGKLYVTDSGGEFKVFSHPKYKS